MDLRVAGKYRFVGKVGSGSFGDIYKGINIKTNELVAIKLELLTAKHPQLVFEAKLYKLLQGGEGIPNVHWFGSEGDYNVMIIDFLGPSLENLFLYTNKKFSLKTVLMITDQLIQRMEFIHSKGLIHRDIKPDNFLIGVGKTQHIVYAIDFGLAKRFWDPKTNKHIPYRDGKDLTGTVRYVSINTHMGVDQSRRDDMESIGYMMLYLLKGALPWQNLKAKTKNEKYDMIKEKKVSVPIETLCEGNPEEFGTYITYCRKLGFEEKPDYAYLRRIYKDLFVRNNYKYDDIYDWLLIRPPKKTAMTHLEENKFKSRKDERNKWGNTLEKRDQTSPPKEATNGKRQTNPAPIKVVQKEMPKEIGKNARLPSPKKSSEKVTAK